MSVYVFWSNHDGAYVSTFTDRERAEKGIEILLAPDHTDYGTTVHGVVEGKQLVIHEEEAVKIVRVKLKQE